MEEFIEGTAYNGKDDVIESEELLNCRMLKV
jgi:hypothetical protein